MSDLRRQLEEAAASHRPDRARMLARVERARDLAATGAEPRGARARRTRPAWPRVALAAVAAAAVCAIGATAVTSLVQEEATGPQKVSTGALPETSAATPPTTGDRPPPQPGRSRTTDGPLWADGSVAPDDNVHWAQSNVTLKTQEPLTALTVELFVARTDRLRSTGRWETRPTADFDLSVHERDGMLVYRWTLRSGRTVPAGTHVFAGQYDHASGGRDAGADVYRATAKAASGTYEVHGDFAPTT
ncbi:hypothetical protein [Streptomyces sp. ADI98-10]|uniref:hypothetical protein n=1 Tax=Streptomyces sp. ADI98-10 TaxID=1522763 RepID=UPI000F556597|nr:hypothetical protein [Streptomyces sp. ADI98-10]RPK89503.1 hypothetical protein EES46_15445 [Streptomyces sp. ADI98-10]